MKLIIGLGNPGDKYRKTRHNAGFLCVEYLQQEQAEIFTNWRLNKRHEAEVSTAKINHEEIVLAKPQTFMNESGRSVQKIAKKHKLENITDLIVIHDDIDLQFGTFKVQSNRGTAGHNGVNSVVEHMKTQEFARVRIGVYPEHMNEKHASGPSGSSSAPLEQRSRGRPGGDTTKFVLQPFSKEEIETLYGSIFPKIAKELIEL